MPSLVARFASCIRDVKQWMCSNRLKLNCDKTELLSIASSNTFQSVGPMPPVVIGSSMVQLSNGTRNLGFYFDRQLDMKQHISNICRSCFFQLRQLRVIRRTLPKDVLKTLLHVSSHLDYCNSLFYGLPKCHIGKLQTVQNAAARLFGGLRKYDYISPVLKNDLHWLPIKQRASRLQNCHT